ncbi:MAG: phosphate signaling complex protein PhoU [Pirellulales bacterium]|nr:phosphate signaling complex protein PhoU [Planctomycetales bacterium]
MTKQLHRDMEAVQRDVLAMSAMVEEMINKACRALREKDWALANEVLETDTRVDEREVRVEEECLKVLALHQPVAIDLRRTAAVLKINNDLERIADLAVNIAERAQYLADEDDFPVPPALGEMARLAIAMVRDALDSFVEHDAQAARRVIARDDVVDNYNRAVIEEMYERMRSNPEHIGAAMHCFSASRHIERIADHATNIAEDVVYLVEGEICRHRPTGQEQEEKESVVPRGIDE